MVENNEIYDQEILALANEIFRYLKRIEHDSGNPGDTARGIAKWWMSRQRYEESVGKVEKALDKLAEQGLINKRKLMGGEIHYQVGRPEKD